MLQIPEREALTAAIRGVKDDCCAACACPEAPEFHNGTCQAFVPIRLEVCEDEWNLFRDDENDDPDPVLVTSESTVGFYDEDDVIEQIADQLLNSLPYDEDDGSDLSDFLLDEDWG